MTSGLITHWKLEAWVLVTGKNPGKRAQETHLAPSVSHICSWPEEGTEHGGAWLLTDNGGD